MNESSPLAPRPALALPHASGPARHDLPALGRQYARFAAVGGLATLTHLLVYAGLIELLALAPLASNTAGFALAVNLSYLGHRRWTFAGGPAARSGSLVRFVAVAGLGLVLNTLFVHLVTAMLDLHYGWSVPLIAGATPLLAFTLSRWWVFGG